MLYTLAVVLFVLWLLGFAVFHVAGGLIHLLLVVAVIVVLLRIIEGRPVV
ncbi:MAG: lmo0937 family membrane protein [Gemmatimonadaceae bacterium]